MIKSILIAVATVYALIGAAMYFGQRRFLYFPDPSRTLPEALGLRGVAEETIVAPDGTRILAWYGKAQPGQPTLLYFHGNGGALEDRAERFAGYMALGRGVYMMSYRGYSGSEGSPTEAYNIADAKRGYDALVSKGVAPGDIILYGESLGTGVAVQVASDKPVAGVILDSPFTSIVDRAAELYRWLPVRLLMTDRYDSIGLIAQVRAPLFILHGEADVLVPVAMGRALYAAANEPKEILTLPGAGHADHYMYGSFDAINGWIDRLRAGAITSRK